jgi:chromosome segregation ATPase
MSDNLTRKRPGGSNGKFDELFQIVQEVRAELSDLRNTVNKRLYDSRPMWEKLDGDITKLQTDVTELSRGVREIRTHQRDMNRRMSIFNDTLATIQADYRDIYDRVREIEQQRS